MKTISATIHGTIHGVGFKYFVQRCAREYGVNGYIKNEDDGTMTVLASGNDSKVETFLNQIEKGNGFSNVDFIVISILENSTLKEFKVIY